MPGSDTAAVSPQYVDGVTVEQTYDEAVAQADFINTLSTRIGELGFLSNLVWNTRNRYLAAPNGTFTAAEMRTMVEAFLAEVVTARHQSVPD